jgi:GTP-binding GTPase N-terminal
VVGARATHATVETGITVPWLIGRPDTYLGGGSRGRRAVGCRWVVMVWHHDPVRRYRTGPPTAVLAGADVMIIGLFSAKDRAFTATLDLLAATVRAHGGRVVGRCVQRRGVSHGGVAAMSTPFSRRTLLSSGKAREVAQACQTAGVTVAVFVNPLTTHQRRVLADLFGCLVISGEDLVTTGR